MNTIQRAATQVFFLTYQYAYAQGYNIDVCKARALAAERAHYNRAPVALSFYACNGLIASD
jgi:hypothetical protein